MFTPRGYTAVPQDASQDEYESDNLSKSFEQRKTESTFLNTNAMTTPRTSRDSEEGEKERRTKRNVRFESRSLEEKPEPMSNARRLCFVVSLMICTLTIFVFAFTVPCKGPSCNVANMITTVTSNLEKFHRNWSVVFPGYSTGIVFHLSSTKRREVVVSYGGRRVKEKQKHQMGKSGLISLREDNGDIVWLYNASDVIKLIECRTDDNNFETCLIQSSRGKLQLINPKRNQIVWSTRILIGSILPSIIIGINDCDGDDGRDILLSYDHFNTTCMPPSANRTTCTHPGIVQLLSGRTGYLLGNRLNIPQSHLIKRVSVHSSRQAENLIFVMTVGNKGHVKVISIQELYRKILDARGGDSIYLFKNSTVSVSDIVSTDHEPVVKDLNKDFVQDIILVTLAGSKHSLTAVDGGKLKRMWRIAFGSRKMLSQPVIGHFNDDEIPDILVILEDPVLSLLNQSLVQILDGQNGNILWSRKLRLAKNTTPLAANIAYKNDVFLLWIEKESNRKYKKIFPSKAAPQKSDQTSGSRDASPKVVLSDAAHRAGKKNVSENTIVHKVEHHRSPRSVQSHEKETSSASDMKTELDSLVDEIYAKHVRNTPITQTRQNPHFKPKKSENTHQLLEDILKEERHLSKVVSKESVTDGKEKATTRLATQLPVLHSINAHGKQSTNREKVRQTMINGRNSGTNARKPNPTLTTQLPKVHNNRYHVTKKPSIKFSNRGRHVLMNNLGNGVNTARHGIPTILATGHRTFHGNTHGITKEPHAKISNGKRVQKVTIDNPGNRINGKIESFTGGRSSEPFTSLHNIHSGIKEYRTEMKNKKIEGQGIIYSSGGKINGESRKRTATFASTERPNVIHAITKRPNNIKTSIKELKSNNQRQSATDILPTGRSLLQYKIRDIQKPSTSMADGQGIKQVKIDSTSRTATLATVRPESHGEIHTVNTKSTTRMVNDEKAGEDLIHNPVSGNNDQGSKTVSLDSNFHSTEHISNLVTSSTLAKDQRNIKISPDNPGNSWNDGSVKQPSTKHSSVFSGINSQENLKTNNHVTSSPHTFANHHVGNTAGITVEGIRDFNSENTKNIVRYGKDVIVLPTRSSITKQPTDVSRNDIQNKRVERPTHANQNNSAFSDTGDAYKVDIAHGIRGEIAEFKSSVGLASSSQHAIIDKSRIRGPVENPWIEISNKRSSFINGNNSEVKLNHTHNVLNHNDIEKPSTKPQILSEKRQGKDVNVNDLTESNNTLRVLKAKVNAKDKHHDRVLSNAGVMEENIGLGKKSTKILNPMKLNRTGHLKENQTSQGKLTKSNQLERKGTSLKHPLFPKKGTPRQQPQSLKTTQDHKPKLGNIHTSTKPGTPISKTKHDVECSEGFDLALIAIFPNSRKNSFSVISQENSVRKTKVSSAPTPCDTLWPTLNSSPLVHDADSDGFMEVIYAVNYGTLEQNERTMNIKKFSIKVDSE